MRKGRGAAATPTGGIVGALALGLLAGGLAPAPASALPVEDEDDASAHAPAPASEAARAGAGLSIVPLSFSLEPERRPQSFFDMQDWRKGLAESFGVNRAGIGLVPLDAGAGPGTAPEETRRTVAVAQAADSLTPLPAALPLLGLGLALLALVARRRRR